jgi:hypothetical protein
MARVNVTTYFKKLLLQFVTEQDPLLAMVIFYISESDAPDQVYINTYSFFHKGLLPSGYGYFSSLAIKSGLAGLISSPSAAA